MQKQMLIGAAVAGLGFVCSARAALHVQVATQHDVPAPGLSTSIVSLYTDTDRVVVIDSAAFSITGAGTRFYNVDFDDGDGDPTTTFQTVGLDYWNGDPERGFNSSLEQPVSTITNHTTGVSGLPYSGSLPLPPSSKAFDTHFLGDFNFYTNNRNYKYIWMAMPGNDLASTSGMLSGRWFGITGWLQTNPLQFAQLVYDSHKTINYSVNVYQHGTVSGSFTAPEPFALPFVGLAAVFGCQRRRREK